MSALGGHHFSHWLSTPFLPLFQRMNRHIDPKSEEAFPATILLQTLIVENLFLFFFLIFYYWFADQIVLPFGKVVFGVLVSALFALLIHSTWILTKGHYRLARGITLSAATLAILLSIGLTGGFPISVASPTLIIPAALTYCLCGGQAGGRMAACLFGVALAQWFFCEWTGFQMPNFSMPEKHTLNQFIVLTATFLILILSFFVYDRANVLLRLQRDREREQLAEMVNRDQLTGLANARYIEDRLQQATARIDRHGGQLALLYLDFNGFKKINDDHGHRLGDVILARMAERMRDALRVEDVVARLGGDEFAVLIDNFTDQQAVDDVITRLHATIRNPIEIDGRFFSVTASIGSVAYPRDVTQKHMIIELADRAMYRAKRLQHDPQAILHPTLPADPPAALMA